MSARQVKLIREAKRKYGRRLDELNLVELRRVTAATAGVSGVVQGAIELGAATIETRVAGRTVPLEILAERQGTCNTCPYLIITTDGEPACSDCGCSGRERLATKLRSRKKRCRKWSR